MPKDINLAISRIRDGSAVGRVLIDFKLKYLKLNNLSFSRLTRYKFLNSSLLYNSRLSLFMNTDLNIIAKH